MLERYASAAAPAPRAGAEEAAEEEEASEAAGKKGREKRKGDGEGGARTKKPRKCGRAPPRP